MVQIGHPPVFDVVQNTDLTGLILDEPAGQTACGWVALQKVKKISENFLFCVMWVSNL